MGNQARVAPNSTCVSTSTRNFPNRLGQSANVYLASVAAVLGKLPTVAEYREYAKTINSISGDIYRYMNFDRMPEYTEPVGKINVALLSVLIAAVSHELTAILIAASANHRWSQRYLAQR